MLLSCRLTLSLFEATEAETGVVRTHVTGPLNLDARALSDPSQRVDWATLVAILDQTSRLLNGDVTRLRAIGGAMLNAPVWTTVQRIARTLTSSKQLYRFVERWVAPANFPHMTFSLRVAPNDRVVLGAAIPEPHAPSEAFHEVSIGMLAALPRLLGLSSATVERSHVTGRTLEVELQVPRDGSLLGRTRRRIHSVLLSSEREQLLERQREELAESMAALQRRQAELWNVLERLPDLVVIHIEGTVVWANRAFVLTLGFSSSAEIVGSPLIGLVDPRSHETFRARTRQPPGAPAPELTEAWLRTRTGGSCFVEVAPTQAVLFDGVPARLVVGRDIDERVRLHQRLLASDRLASLGLLAAGVAHEVNNPLGYILNNIEIASKDFVKLGRSGARGHEALSIALEGVDRIRVIVRDLLMIARGGDGACAPTDLRAVVESTLMLAKGDIGRTARIGCDLRPVPLAHADESRVAQVLLNLLLNALDAVRARERDRARINVRLMLVGDRILLEVSDTGTGITSEDLAKIFDPFFTTKPAGKGTGLGLAITQRLVTDLGGEIQVESEVDVGTTFRVYLPVLPDEPRSAPPAD